MITKPCAACASVFYQTSSFPLGVTYFLTFVQHQQVNPAGNFGYLADQANPLSTAYPSAGAPATAHVSYQTQSSYGFQPQPVAVEGAEQQDQVDYYNHIENTVSLLEVWWILIGKQFYSFVL